MIPAGLILALIQNVGLPELERWLHARHAAGEPVDEGAILALLQKDADEGIASGEAWLAAHPVTPPSA